MNVDNLLNILMIPGC